MSGFARLLGGAMLMLACGGAIAAATDAEPQPVQTLAAWRQVIASGAPTPLDALTPYGKRRFIDSMRWGERGLGGFSTAPLVRELDERELGAVLRWLDAGAYQAMLARGIVGAPLRLPAPSADVDARLVQFERFVDDEHARRRDADAPATAVGSPAVLQRWRELFGNRMGAAALARQPTGDLLPLFDAASRADDDNPDSPAFAELLLIHRALAARGIDTRRTLDATVLDALLAARRFEEARAFAAARPHLGQAVPLVDNALAPDFAGRSVFDYDAARNTLRRSALPYPSGTELVMVVGAGCHFSQDALQAIATDAAFQARLRGARLLLVTPPRAPIPLGYIAAWNAAHPALPIRIPADARAWQAVDVQGTPEFYLLDQGRRIGKVSGWPAAGNRAAVLGLADGAAP